MASQGGMPPRMTAKGPPYPPMVWPLGGSPEKGVDIPAQSVFMVLFMIGAAVHMKIFQKNKARGHKFLASLFIFLCNPTNISLAIAVQIFIAAGVLILFIINLIFAIRLVRSTHPSVGWHIAFGIAFKALCALVGLTIVAVIATTVQSFYTLERNTRATDRGFQQYGATFLAIVAILPLPITILTLFIPYSPIDRFGIGRLRTKVIVLLISTMLLSLGAWFRCGVTFQTPVPRSQPLPGYLGKAPFYIFNFLVEIQTVLMYAILRVDLRWYIPDGANGPGSYARPQVQQDVEMQDSRPTSSESKQADSKTLRTISEKEDEDEEINDEKAISSLEPPKIIEIDLGNSSRSSLAPPDPETRRNSARSSLAPLKAADRSARSSILSERLSMFISKSTSTLTTFATPEQKQRWRESEEARIVRRLGGPWQQLPSPTETTFSANRSPRESVLSPSTAGDAGVESPTPAHIRSGSEAPSIPDVVSEGGWTPRIEWEFGRPRRFLSLKKRSMIGLNISK
ncbi:sequence-specific DNA binding RNA polymerase II transcription factor [Stemphylium lycopersici]|uniref:Sequence-specific DNA binding RNA polymerase II transcription factor n=1 Tax=Stemphylium lycopersici TaxID=183478 RepID=A0A364ND44_STELY|nr:hypothetical protein TW65_06146 [Stemphylium lycopersici]RAR10461.1 sequence-specific DNA binding RNA polymerase II transcription factor [Stemphylium lycopersici]RAR15170.1 sequence-specific DNA binding RNA polymerase II transcription factor [Stemphylium lycopersici]